MFIIRNNVPINNPVATIEGQINMAHDYTSKNDYIMQIPYLNEEGRARVITIRWHDARELVEAGSHRLLRADDGLYLVTPIKPAATNHVYQIGCDAV